MPRRTRGVAGPALGVLVVALVAACGSVPPDTRLEGTRSVGAPTSIVGPAGAGPTTTSVGGTILPARTTVPRSPATATGPATTGVAPPSPLAWQNCGDKLQCAVLTVPKDYDDPSKGTLDLFVKRRPASRTSRRIGSLLVNPGGPGVPGSVMSTDATGYFGTALLDRFDIVAWDPRGTGKSSQIVCVDNLDPYFTLDISPDDAAEHQALIDVARSFDDQCAKRNAGLLPYVSTEASAHDMDRIRQALGEPKISYFGFSYGSDLGAVWATLFPSTVRAMVIDGAIDPTVGTAGFLKQQAVGLERGLNALLAACAKDRACPIYNGGNPAAIFDKVMAELDRAPLPVVGAPGRPVTQSVAAWAAGQVLYLDKLWPLLTAALAAEQKGDGQPLLDLYDSFITEGGELPHVYDALVAINCLDDPSPSTQQAFDALDVELRALAPRRGPYVDAQPFCVYWPVKGRGRVKVTGKGAGPVVVVGTTGDPVTPIESSANMAKALEGAVFVTATANRHTGYQTGACIDDAIESYLLDLKVPPAGLVCAGG